MHFTSRRVFLPLVALTAAAGSLAAAAPRDNKSGDGVLVESSSSSSSSSGCGFPGLPANGSLVGAAGLLFYPGEQVRYRCFDGFVLFGEETRTCGEDGAWSGATPICRLNLAVGRPSLQSSTLWGYDPGLAVDADPDTCSFTPKSKELRWWQVHLTGGGAAAAARGDDDERGDATTEAVAIESVAVSVSPGTYQRFTIFVIELLEGNKALYKPCSKFDGAFTERRVAFICGGGGGGGGDGAEVGLSGQFVYVRDDRAAEDHFGLCEVEVFRVEAALPCGDPEQPASSRVDVAEATARYSCMKGFRMAGVADRECLSTGMWSGTPPTCQEIQCDHSRSVKDGFIEVSNFRGKYVFGSLATYHCNPGYVLWGNASRLCGEGGVWSGFTPECKPITCGRPPERANAVAHLVNGSTLWRSRAEYACKPGFVASSSVAAGGAVAGPTRVAAVAECGESGLWEPPVEVDCRFDPEAAAAAAGQIEGWRTLRGDSRLGAGVLATVATVAVAAAALAAALAAAAFFARKRLNRESEANRKTSQTSTHQLLQGGGGGGRGEGGESLGSKPRKETQFDTFPRRVASQQQQHLDHLSTFRPSRDGKFRAPKQMVPLPLLSCDVDAAALVHPDLALLHSTASAANRASAASSSSSSSMGQRSAGDGGSEDNGDEFLSTAVEGVGYARLRLCHKGGDVQEVDEEDEEESHYCLIRQPDGREFISHGLHQPHSYAGDVRWSAQDAPVGIESAKVREKVYETLSRRRPTQQQQQHHAPPPSLLDDVMTSSGESGVGASSSAAAAPTSIKGIRPRLRPPASPPELPPPDQHRADTAADVAADPSCLYARVDVAKKRARIRGDNGNFSDSTGSTPCSPMSPMPATVGEHQQHAKLSPTKSLIQKFNSMGGGGDDLAGPWQAAPQPSLSSAAAEPLYATIGSKNRSQNASRFAVMRNE